MVERTERKLTPKQEAFCAFFLSSKKPGESYTRAGYASEFASENAAILLKNNKIQARLAELQARVIPPEALQDAAVAILSERAVLLSKIARSKVDLPISAGHVTQAISELNKMEHVYEAGAFVRDIKVVFVIGRGYQQGLPSEVEPKQLSEGNDFHSVHTIGDGNEQGAKQLDSDHPSDG